MRKKKKNSFQNFNAVAKQDGHGDNATSVKKFDALQIEKEFSEILNYQRKQENNLLGVFVGNKYKISQQIMDQLVSLPKKFDRIENNVLYAATVLGEFVLNFKIEMEISPDFCKAKLFLIEIEQGVEEDLKHLTLLSEVVEPYMFEFRNYLCQKWNIFFDDVEIEKGDGVYTYLRLQNEEFMFNRELIEILSQLYVVRMLSHLDNLGELGEKIKYEFKLLMEKFLATDLSIKKNFSKQKNFLDFLFSKHKAFDEILKTEEGGKILLGYSNPFKNIRDKTYPTILDGKQEQKTPANKKANSKEKPKKKSSPSKSNSGKAVDVWKGVKSEKVGGSVSFPKLSVKTEKPLNLSNLKTDKTPVRRTKAQARDDLAIMQAFSSVFFNTMKSVNGTVTEKAANEEIQNFGTIKVLQIKVSNVKETKANDREL